MRALVRGKARKWLLRVWLSGCLLCVKACVLSFPDYPEADLCAASDDAGFHPSTAPDPALRGCDAGTKANPDPEVAGAAGMEGAP